MEAAKRRDNSLEVHEAGRLIFASTGKWLYPLLELEEFLADNPAVDPATVRVKDKIVGRAAALLMVRMGLKQIHAALLSRLGLDALIGHGVDASYDTLVDQIQCQTEEILRNVADPDEAHRIIRKRAARSQEAS